MRQWDQLNDNLGHSCNDRDCLHGVYGSCSNMEHVHKGLGVLATTAQEEQADEVSPIDVFGAPLKKNWRGLGKRMLGAGNCEPYIYLDSKASNGGTKKVRQIHFLKFQVKYPNSVDLAGNRAKTKLLNLANLAGNRAKTKLQEEFLNLENVAGNRAKTEIHMASEGS